MANTNDEKDSLAQLQMGVTSGCAKCDSMNKPVCTCKQGGGDESDDDDDSSLQDPLKQTYQAPTPVNSMVKIIVGLQPVPGSVSAIENESGPYAAQNGASMQFQEQNSVLLMTLVGPVQTTEQSFKFDMTPSLQPVPGQVQKLLEEYIVKLARNKGVFVHDRPTEAEVKTLGAELGIEYGMQEDGNFSLAIQNPKHALGFYTSLVDNNIIMPKPGVLSQLEQLVQQEQQQQAQESSAATSSSFAAAPVCAPSSSGISG